MLRGGRGVGEGTRGTRVRKQPVGMSATMGPRTDIEPRRMATLAGAGSLLAELRLVMERQVESASREEIVRWVVEDNILLKRTQAGRREVARKLAKRYGLCPGSPVFARFCSAWRAAQDSGQEGLLAFLMYGAHDGSVRLISSGWLAPLLRRPGTPLTVDAVLAFIDGVARSHPNIGTWSPKTRLSVAQHFLTAARDYGLATGKASKHTVRPTVGPVVAWFAASLAQLQGVTPEETLASVWFHMLGLDFPAVVDALYAMAASGLGRFRVEGQVVELELREHLSGS